MQPPSQNTADNKAVTHASEDAGIPQQAQTEKIEALLESVNSASQHVRNYYITFLLAGFYIAMIVWSTTDLMLLKDTPVKMPLLDVELPITGFYTSAPYFFLLLHFNLLLQFSLLADKVHRFDHAVIKLTDSNSRDYYYTRLFAFAFTQTLSGRHHSRLLRFLLTLMVWISTIWLPLGILIGLQVGFLAYHSEEILSWQRMAIMLDLLVLIIFWPIIRSPDGNGFNWILRASGFSFIYLWIISRLPTTLPKASKIARLSTQNNPTENSGNPLFEGGLSLVTLLLVVTFSWAIAVLPDSHQEKAVRDWLADNASFDWKSICPSKETGQPYFKLTEQLFDGIYVSNEQCSKKPKDSVFNRNLIIREQLLIANELKAEDEADLMSEDEVIHQTALKKVIGLVLSNRDLRYADFSGSRLPKVDFVGADEKPSDLSYANFSYAMLVDAFMSDSKLQGADLAYAKLQGANLWNAQLLGTDLFNARLQGANLNFAKLQGANLRGALLLGAKLNKAELQGANLWSAQLLGANLFNAQLQGAVLRKAGLQGANLTEAQLQGTDLSNTDLLGAVLKMTDLSHSDMSAASFGTLIQLVLEALQAAIAESIHEDQLLQRINATLTDRAEEQATISQATGKDVWDNDSSRRSKYDSDNAFGVAKDESTYQNKLAAYFLDLSCHNRWTAAGIIRNRIVYSISDNTKPILLASSFAQCLLSLRDQKNKAGRLVCPAISKIDEKTFAILDEVAISENPNSSIQPTFACQTKLSDQKQPSE